MDSSTVHNTDITELEFSDLIRQLSPSPRPSSPASSLSTAKPRRKDSPTSARSPEPLDHTEVEGIRKWVEERYENSKNFGSWNGLPVSDDIPREEVLAQMVHHLTRILPPAPSQLISQAETISNLIQQRDLLLSRDREERGLWDAERNGWIRLMGALAERAKKEGSLDIEDLERNNNWLSSENKLLRQRLHDTQLRLSTLEAELHTLRPLFLVHATARNPSSTLKTSIPPASAPRPVGRPRKKPKEPEVAVGLSDSEDEVSRALPTRHHDMPMRALHRQRNNHNAFKSPTTGDARVEHLILASRKIGKDRVSQLIPDTIIPRTLLPTDSPEGRQQPAKSGADTNPTTPKTPRGRGTANPTTPTWARTPRLLTANRSNALESPSQGLTFNPSLPSSSNLPSSSTRNAQMSTPSGLESLLTAARSVLRPDSSGEEDESPTKRRRLDVNRPATLRVKGKARATTREPEETKGADDSASRVMSALDVLADQAAVVFSTQSQSQQVPASQVNDLPNTINESHPEQDGDGARKDVDMEDAAGDLLDEGDTADRDHQSPDSHPHFAPSTSKVTQESTTPQPRTVYTYKNGPQPPRPGRGLPSSFAPVDLRRAEWDDKDDVTPKSKSVLGPPIRLTPPRNRKQPEVIQPPTDLASEIVGASDEQSDSRDPSPSTDIRMNQATSRSHSTHSQMEGTSQVKASGSNSNDSGADSTVQNQSDSASTSAEVSLAPEPHALRFTNEMPSRKTRSPYVKWSKEEDELLSKAVAKFGQKWDLVQKALPSRGYHQVRQRWLRKLGVLDSKSDNAYATNLLPRPSENNPMGNAAPKLGLAPLSSEVVMSGSAAGSSSRPGPSTF